MLKSNLFCIGLVLIFSGKISTLSVDQKVNDLMKNLTLLRTETVRSDVFQLYIKQDSENRQKLEQRIDDLTQNYTALQVLYEDVVQQEQQLKTLYDKQRQYIDILSKALLDSKSDTALLNASLRLLIQNIGMECEQLRQNITDMLMNIDNGSWLFLC